MAASTDEEVEDAFAYEAIPADGDGGGIEGIMVQKERKQRQDRKKNQEFYGKWEGRAKIFFIFAFLAYCGTFLVLVRGYYRYYFDDSYTYSGIITQGDNDGEAAQHPALQFDGDNIAVDGGEDEASAPSLSSSASSHFTFHFASQLEEKSQPRFLHDHKFSVVMYYEKRCADCQRMSAAWDQAAEEYSPDNVVGIATVDCEAQRDLCLQERILAYPTLRMYRHGQVVVPHCPLLYRTSTPMIEYINRRVLFEEKSAALNSVERIAPLQDKDEKEIEDEPKEDTLVNQEVSAEEEEPPPLAEPQDDEDDHDYKSTIERGFQSAVSLDKNSHAQFIIDNPFAFVMFYAPWCMWSQRLAPIWEEVAEHYSEPTNHNAVGIGAVDCMAHATLCHQERIMAFPTLRLYAQGKALQLDYKMDRTRTALVAYVDRQKTLLGGGSSFSSME